MNAFEILTTETAESSPRTAGGRGGFFGGTSRRKKFVSVPTFTPCVGWFRLLETVNSTAQKAAFGDVILLSPACSGLDQFRNQPSAGKVSSYKMRGLADAMGGMSSVKYPNTQTAGKLQTTGTVELEKKVSALHRGFLRQNPGAKTQPKPTSQERTPTSANHS